MQVSFLAKIALLVLALPVLQVLSCFAVVAAGERKPPESCSYQLQVWNVNLRGVSETRTVRHPYDGVAAAETDAATGCTVCSEDQVEIVVRGLEPFSVCHKLAPQVRTLVSGLVKDGAAIRTVIGYHPIRSRGNPDEEGNRTAFSNHSYGTAIDIDPDKNGLYDDCSSFGPQCRLLRGGAWSPGAPGSLTRDSVVVRSFKAAGFKWGGEIEGKQKDFMHFSPTGY